MEPTDQGGDNELQKAINNITSASSGVASDTLGAADVASVNYPADTATMADAVSIDSPVSDMTSDQKAIYGDPDLGVVKVKALTDLRPLVEKVDLSPEAKFKIYKEIIVTTNDKAAIEPGYMAAAGIAVEKDKAEALLFIVETIDRLGIGAS